MAFTLWFCILPQVFRGIVDVEEGKEGGMIVDPGSMKQPTVLALATCHALVVVDNKIVRLLPPVHPRHALLSEPSAKEALHALPGRRSSGEGCHGWGGLALHGRGQGLFPQVRDVGV